MRAQCEACRAVRRRTMVWGGLPALAFTGAFMYISSPLTVPKLLGPPLCDVVATAVAIAVAAGTRCWGATNRCPPPTAVLMGPGSCRGTNPWFRTPEVLIRFAHFCHNSSAMWSVGAMAARSGRGP